MSDKPLRVFIRNLELLARIGVHGHEQSALQPVRINVELEVRNHPDSDRLEDVVDYEKIADAVRAIVAGGHINLAETLANRIADSCLEDRRVQRARVCVEKLHAVQGAEAAGVEVERSTAS